MNAEQLHTIASIVIEDVDKSKILQNFNEIQTHLRQLAGNPGDPNVQQNVATVRAQLFESVDILERKRWPAGVQQTVDALGGGILVEGQIKETVQNIIQAETITPSTALEQITAISSEIVTFVEHVRSLKVSFENLNIEEEPLDVGSVELGVLIPREEIENKLENLGHEITQIDKILKLFSVVAIGSREEFELTYLSSSDPKIFTKPNIKTAALVGATVAFILSSLNQIADLKIKYDEIAKSGIDEKHLKGLEKGIKEKLDKDLEGFREELIEQFSCHTEPADRNEDKNRLKIAIDQLAPRLERGYSVEIRVGVLPGPDEGGEEEREGSTDEDTLIENLQDTAQRLKRIAPIGKPVLSLPKPETLDDEGKDDQK